MSDLCLIIWLVGVPLLIIPIGYACKKFGLDDFCAMGLAGLGSVVWPVLLPIVIMVLLGWLGVKIYHMTNNEEED